MKSILLLFLLSLSSYASIAQYVNGDFPFAYHSKKELELKFYEKDSSANAVVLNEFGNIWFGNNKSNLYRIFKFRHKKIKILNRNGFGYGDISIHLNKIEDAKEIVTNFRASVFNSENDSLKEESIQLTSFFTDNKSPNQDVLKYAFPKLKEGSIIEFSYTIESPFVYNIPNWNFQSDIPKLISEVWITLKYKYDFFMVLKGHLNLSKNEVVEDRSDSKSGAIYKFGLTHIPAFIEEKYMTASSNFLSSIKFEYIGSLAYFRTDKKDTSMWKYVDARLMDHEGFGGVIKQPKNGFWKHKLDSIKEGTSDSLLLAKKVYHLVQKICFWNEYNSIYSYDVKKIYNKKEGDSGDINLTLISALRSSGLPAFPVILSTRENGYPIESVPILSNYNYVVAVCAINGKRYFLDATEKHLGFGQLPSRCLNGKGRIFNSEFKSSWIDIPTTEKERTVVAISAKMSDDARLSGTIIKSYYGLDAFERRRRRAGFNNLDEYKESLKKNMEGFNITNISFEKLEELDSNLVENIAFETSEELIENKIFMNPFKFMEIENTPFKSEERFYPVDFGLPQEKHLIFHLEFPESYSITGHPEKFGKMLPAKGGKYLLNVNLLGNKLTINSLLSLEKPIYSPEEYYYLKELFNKMILAQSEVVIFEKNPNKIEAH